MRHKLASASCVQRKNEEDGKLTLNGIPFHAVLVGDLTKLVLGNRGQRVVVKVVVVDLGSKVELPLGLELVV